MHGEKMWDFVVGFLWEIYNQLFRGISGNENWGVSQHEICGRFTTNFLEGSQGPKIGELHSMRFVGDLQPTF